MLYICSVSGIQNLAMNVSPSATYETCETQSKNRLQPGLPRFPWATPARLLRVMNGATQTLLAASCVRVEVLRPAVDANLPQTENSQHISRAPSV